MYEKTKNELHAIIDLLEKDSSRWSQFFRKAQAAFEQGDYQRCAEIILSGRGGMGSLNDLVLGQTVDENGQFKWKQGYEETNKLYQALLSSLYRFAQNIRHGTH